MRLKNSANQIPSGKACQTIWIAYTCSKCGRVVIEKKEVSEQKQESLAESIHSFVIGEWFEKREERMKEKAQINLERRIDKFFREADRGGTIDWECSCPFCGHYEPWVRKKSKLLDEILPISGVILGLILMMAGCVLGAANENAEIAAWIMLAAGEIMVLVMALVSVLAGKKIGRKVGKKKEEEIKNLPADSIPIVARTMDDLNELMMERYGFAAFDSDGACDFRNFC